MELKVLGLPVVFGVVDVEVGEHAGGGAPRYGHLRPAVEAGPETRAGVADPESYEDDS